MKQLYLHLIKQFTGFQDLGRKPAVILSLMFFLMLSASAQAQNEIRGTVIDSDANQPLPGVTVLEKGTSNGTTTDFDGNYSLTVKDNATLIFSYVGFTTKELQVSGSTTLDVSMEADLNLLNEVILIDYGYGKVKKEDMTGSVASITSEEISKIPVTSASEAIAGRLPGVNVTSNDGEPGAGVRIRVRGGTSISQNNEPLYVVDGLIVNSISDIPPNDIETINVFKDAASTAIYGSQGANGVVVVTTKNPQFGKVSVDYNNFFQFNYLPNDRRYEVLSPYEYVLANYEFAQLGSAADQRNFETFFGNYDDLELYKSRKGTDWQEELFGDARVSQYHNISISGGSEKTKMRLSVSDNSDQGLLTGSAFNRTAVNFKINQEIFKNLSFDAGSRITTSVIDGAGTSNNAQIRIKDAVQTRPINGLVDEIELDPNLVGDAAGDYETFLRSLISPTELVKQDYRKRTDNSYVFNAGLTWKVIDQLTLKSTFTTEKRFREQLRFYGPLTSESFNNGGNLPIGVKNNENSDSYRLFNTANFRYNELEDHNFDFLVGFEVSSDKGKASAVRGEDYRESITPEELFANMQFGRIDQYATSEATPVNRYSFFGRLDYQFKSKYIATATFRVDKSSVFSEEYNTGVFPALALGWQIHKEDFLADSDVVDNLKLRISYGAVGNDAIPGTAKSFLFKPETLRAPGFGNSNSIVYYTPQDNVLYNPDLKWETTISRNLGLDFGFFNGKLSGSFDVYKNSTSDLLFTVPISPNSGFDAQYDNAGSTSNTGIELGLNAVFVQNQDFTFSGNFNIGRNKTRIDELANGVDERFARSNWASTDLENINDYYLREGGKLGDMYGYVNDGFYTSEDFAGYDEASGRYTLNEGVPNSGNTIGAGNANIRPGYLKLKDISGPDGVPDGVIDANDRRVIGNAIPDFQGGFGFNATWKGFDASIFFNFQVGNDVYNTGKIQYNSFRRATYGNLLSTMSSDNRYTYLDVDGSITGTAGSIVTDLDQLATLNADKNIWSAASTGSFRAVVQDWAIEDGSFLRLNNLNIGYSLPKSLIERVGLTKLRIYAAGRNLKLWTNYTGYDPEVSTESSGFTPGVDYSAFPRSRSYTFGMNLTF